MATICATTIDSVKVDSILSDAVVLSWNDLMPGPISGLIHVEYHVEPSGSVEYLKVWASTDRGYWKLICEHWMRWDSFHQSGMHFSNGYSSDELSRTLDAIMQHQEIFLVGAAPGKDRMIQIQAPTASDTAMANKTMQLFRERVAPSRSESTFLPERPMVESM